MNAKQVNKKTIERMNKRIELLRGLNGTLYMNLSNDMEEAIVQNADPSYHGSEAMDTAIRSAHVWNSSGRRVLSNIFAPMFANYRQYGCGGMPIAKLVEVRENNEQDMIDHISDAFHHPEKY
jgi:uncharacterized protein YeeX (DUF496 family)